MMDIRKNKAFDVSLMQQAKLFKALAHPARLSIMLHLAQIKTCITGDIAGQLPLGRTTVNQHLKELRDAGLIKGTVEGVKTNYCLNTEGIEELIRCSSQFFESIDLKETFC
jgi:ArsR family transcriptional regulator, arsenate/arsenite/antimonite-responsive transcriptional repressor